MSIQVELGGGDNRNASRVLLAEIQRSLGQDAVNRLIREFDLGTVFGFREGPHFTYRAPPPSPAVL